MEINTFSRWKLLKNMSLIKNSNNLTISKLAHELNINKYHPYFQEIVRELRKENIITTKEILGNVKIIKLDSEKIYRIVRNSIIFKEVENYVKIKVPFYNV